MNVASVAKYGARVGIFVFVIGPVCHALAFENRDPVAAIVAATFLGVMACAITSDGE